MDAYQLREYVTQQVTHTTMIDIMRGRYITNCTSPRVLYSTVREFQIPWTSQIRTSSREYLR